MEISMNNKGNTKKNSYRVVLIGIAYMYSLFALDRIKNIFTVSINGISTTNEIWLILVISLLLAIGNKRKISIVKSNIIPSVLIFLLFVVFLVGGFKAESITQWVYAGLLFFIPLIMFVSIPSLDEAERLVLIKLFVGTTLFYAVFAIVLSTNYAYFMALVGNPVDNYRYYSQYRASMMLGSSITVSYYLNISLPFCFYLFYTIKQKVWRRLSLIAIIFNILATFILLSRLASLSAVLIALFFFVFVRSGSKNVFKQKVVLILIAVLGFYIIFNNYDLSRLITRINLNIGSVESRGTAAQLGLSIFSDNPLLGSGMGRYYLRAYSNKYILYNGINGLIDPHNLYVLIFSELGIIGSIVVFGLFVYLVIMINRISQKNYRRTAQAVLFIMLLNSMGGSQIINEISFSIVFWIYISIFKFDTNTIRKNKNKWGQLNA